MPEKSFGKMLARRCAACYFTVCLMFTVCILRLYSVATGNITSAGNTASFYSLTLSRPRGTIYDCNGVPLNNRSEKILAAVSPAPQTGAALRSVLGDDPSLTGILDRLRSGKPVICELPKIIECDGITCLSVTSADTADKPAVHTVGYTDSSGHGITGLEAAFDSLLYSEKTTDAVFEMDGSGSVLGGKTPAIRGAEGGTGALYTTISEPIQRITEECCSGITRGAAAVCEVGTGKLRAIVSKPGFDCTDIAKYLTSADAPLLNRALTAYSVGSVFKPCVAAAGIEKGLGSLSFNCTGSIDFDGRAYHCHNRSGHGVLDLGGALSESCNTYFYRFAAAAGGSAVYEKAAACSFGSAFEIAPGYKNAAGKLPDADSLNALSALANLSIGQGKLLLSPVAMLTLYCAIASDGGYYIPTVVEKQISGGSVTRFEQSKKTVVMKEDTARQLRGYLCSALLSGTGAKAAPTLCTAGGKTATAQTGRFDENGNEINIGWFCGFFPAEQPRYAVIVTIENANGYNAAPVFAAVADGITELENGQPRAES